MTEPPVQHRAEVNGTPVPPHGPATPWSDESIELLIGNLLRWGVIIAATVTLIGGVAMLVHSRGQIPSFHTFRGEPHSLNSVDGIIASALQLNSRGIIQLGLLLLIATPVARVALTLFAFLKQGDRQYVVITSIVLILLLLGLTGKIGG